jgi:predicted transcriptional regulator of viral defense system
MSEAALHDLARRQHGLVSRAQAREHLSSAAIRHRLEVGLYESTHAGVYRLAGSPVTWRQELMAAVLAAGERSAIGFLAAAALWSMPDVVEAMPEVVVAAPRYLRIRGVRSHQSDRLLDHHVTVRDGIPVTTPARTLFDASALVGPLLLDRLIASSRRRCIVKPADLLSCL